MSPNQNILSHLKNIHINETNKKWLIGISITAGLFGLGLLWLHSQNKRHKKVIANLQSSDEQNRNNIAKQNETIATLKEQNAQLVNQVNTQGKDNDNKPT